MAADPVRDYYARQGALSDPGPHAELLDDLPREVEALSRVVQGLVIHRNWALAYDVKLSAEGWADAQARSARAILSRILERDARPLHEPRPPAARFAGTCRDFSLLLCSFLRHRGVPARARCGFGTYFEPEKAVDHWVCEHWDAGRGAWVLSDAQIDDLQRGALDLDFDPLDAPRDRFLVAGQAWQQCREGRADPARFGIFDMWGLWFVRGNVARDLAALNKVELLPWDDWGLLRELDDGDESSHGDLFDRAAALTQAGDDGFDALRTLYDADPGLHVPGRVHNFQTGKDETVG